MPYENIFAAVELENANTIVLQRAAAMAQLCKAKLTVMTAIPDLRAMYRGTEDRMHHTFDAELVNSAREQLQTLCDKARIGKPATLILRGDPDHEVAERAQRDKADLIVFGNHDRHGLDQFVGGFGLGLLHRAHCDLLAVNLAAAATDFARPLVALANDEYDAGVLRRVRENFTENTVHAVHVVRPPLSEHISSDESIEAHRSRLANARRDSLEAVLAAFPQFNLEIVFNKPSSGIEKVARDHNGGFIVMGSGHHANLGWHLGSTAHNLLSHTQFDILLVRPE